jgi:hypothetical protein
MTHVNNIYGIKVNAITNNGSINFGNVIHKGHQSNIKANVGSFQIGDTPFGVDINNNVNKAVDPDVLDQMQKQI